MLRLAPTGRWVMALGNDLTIMGMKTMMATGLIATVTGGHKTMLTADAEGR